MRSYPTPDQVGDEIDGEECWWSVDNGPCPNAAVTTYYDDYRRMWIPVCDDHRSGHYYA